MGRLEFRQRLARLGLTQRRFAALIGRDETSLSRTIHQAPWRDVPENVRFALQVLEESSEEMRERILKDGSIPSASQFAFSAWAEMSPEMREWALKKARGK